MSNRTFVRCADPGRSFIDHASGLHIHPAKPIGEVIHLTPLTKDWLLGGGLVKLTPDAVEAHLAGLPAPEASETDSDDSSLEDDEQSSDEGGEEEGEESEEESEGDSPDDEAEGDSLDAILAAGEKKKTKKK